MLVFDFIYWLYLNLNSNNLSIVDDKPLYDLLHKKMQQTILQ